MLCANEQFKRLVRGGITLVASTAVLAAGLLYGQISESPATQAAQTIPYKINFQGRLTDNSGNILADGLYNIKFRLYDALSAGTLKWTEDRIMTGTDNRIQITNGLFNIQFGDQTVLSTALFSGVYPLYLEVELPTPATATCSTNGCAVWTETPMSPRQALAAAPYAFNSDTLDGLDSGAFGQLGSSQSWTGANTFQPTTNISSVLVKQNSSGSFGQDVFAVQGSSSGNFIQVTSTAANAGAVTVQSLGGSNALTLEAAGAISVGASSATAINLGRTGLGVAIPATGVMAVSLTGVPATSGTSSLIQLTAAIASGSGGGTYIGANPGSFSGDFVNFQVANTPKFIVTSAGALTLIGAISAPTSVNTINNLVINGGSLTNVGANITGAGSVTLASGGSNTNLALNAIGNGTASLDTGSTGNITIGNSDVAHTINIGNGGTTVQGITIGSATNTTSTLALQGGNGTSSPAITLTTGVNGSTAGTISIGNSTGANTQAINIGTNSTTNSVSNVTVGSAATGSTGAVVMQGNGITHTITGSATAPSDIIRTSTNSSTAFAVQSASGLATLFNVDTTTNASNLIPAIGAGLETAANPAAAGWTAKGSASLTMSNSASLSFIGSQSLKVTTTATIADGAKYAFSLTNGTSYTLSFYAKLDAASGVFNTMSAGWSDGSNDHDCVVVPVDNNTPIIATQWNRYYCSFVPTSGTNFYVKQTDAAIHTFYLDAIQLESGVTTPTTYREGRISFGGAQLVAPTLNTCDNIVTDSSGNLNCGSGLANHINLIDGSGHSIMRAITQQGNGASSPDYRWMTRLASTLHAQEINRGVDGASSYFIGSTLGGVNSVLQNITPPRNATLTPGNVIPTAPYIARTGIGLIQLGINDLGGLIPSTNGSTNTSGCTAAANCNLIDFKEAMRTIIARYRASAVFEETSNSNSANPLVAAPCTTAVYCIAFGNGTDTWSQQSGSPHTSWSSGTGNEALTGSGTGTQGTVTICLPSDLNSTGGTVDIGLIADALAGQGGTHSFSLDGTAVASVNTNALLSTSNNSTGVISSGRVIESIVRRIAVPAGAPVVATTGCNTGTQHKLIDTVTNIPSGANTYFDYFQIEAPQPEPVLALNIAHDPNSDYSIYSTITGDVVPGDTDVTNINNVLTGLVNEFDANVQVVDEDTALNRNPNNFSSDKLHPNDAGHAAIANAIYQSLVNWPVAVQQSAQGTIGPGFYTFSATNFTVQNTLQNPTILINTTAQNPGGTLPNLILNPSFETDGQNWIANGGTNNTINRSTSSSTAPAYSGNSSLQIVTSGANHDGARYNIALTNSTAYTLSFFARRASGDATPFTTLEAGYINTTPTSVTCVLSSTTVTNTGWQRYSCPFTTVNPLAGGGIYIGSDATAHTFYVDGVLLQQVTNTVNPYLEGGSINLIGSITGPVNFQNTSNSTNAFNIQDSAGYDLMLGDTVNDHLGFLVNNVNNTTPPTNDFTIGTLTTTDASAIVAINATGTPGVSASSKTLVVQGSSAQTGNQFEVQTSAGGAGAGLLFSVNGNSSKVQIGSPTPDSTGTILVLDTKNTSGDPAGTDGAMYYNSTNKSFRCYQNTVWKDCGPLIASNTSVTVFNNTTTETALNSTYTIPADDCQPGRVYRITARGIYGIVSAITGTTITMRVKFGATIIGANNSVTSLNSSAQTNMPWELQYNIICITAGTSGTVEGQGRFSFFSGTNGITGNDRTMFNTAPITVNTTTTNVLQLTGQFGTANAANTMSGREVIIERLGP